ncbi:uncharacterized protein LOC121885456 [Thunnus maccoyii]|uniref:uncharacterized protein LOC121885456 n=1 Tax=Thunnus maccoyii TaxID=8240 RepID=UPI001C4C17B8|nr:uncharacterized protein LOC121885456 [Thunnus maccoyii]
MASSTEELSDLSKLMNKLTERARSFKTQFDKNERRMRQIVREYQKIADEVREMQATTETVRKVGLIAVGVGAGFCILAAPFTGGLSLVGAAVAAEVGETVAAVAAGGAATVVGANIAQTMKENGSAKKVKELVTEFMKIIEAMKNNTQEINMTCEKLEQRSVAALADNTLSNVGQFQMTLKKVSNLGRKTVTVLTLAVTVIDFLDKLMTFFGKVFRVTATPEEDQRLRDSILQSADQCQTIVDEFDKMKNELRNFTGSKEKK